MPDGVTLVAAHTARAGCEAAFARGADRIVAHAAAAPGCLEARSIPPTDGDRDWAGTFRFDTRANLLAWMDSPGRQALADELVEVAEGPASQRVLADPSHVPDEPLATMVVDRVVDDALVGDFLAWQEAALAAQRGRSGFRGAELFRPVPGAQVEWTWVVRYETAEALEAWLRSPEWAELEAAGQRFGPTQVRRIDHAFGSWFDEGDGSGPPPADRLRTAASILVGLYPTVLVLSILLARLLPEDVALWQQVLATNLAAALVMTFVTMPRLVMPVLGDWTRADPPHRWRGWGIAVGSVAGCAAVAWLVTTVLWTLP